MFKDYHETFKLDRYDNPYNGHSTITPTDGEKFSIAHQQRDIYDPIGEKANAVHHPFDIYKPPGGK